VSKNSPANLREISDRHLYRRLSTDRLLFVTSTISSLLIRINRSDLNGIWTGLDEMDVLSTRCDPLM
jgi:hypothetical protein